MTAILCQGCGQPMRRDTRAHLLRFRGTTVEVQQPGWWCNTADCTGDVVVEDADVEATQPEMDQLVLRVEAARPVAATTPRCPECGGSMVHEVRKDTRSYKGRTLEVDQPGWWCPDCGEALFSWSEALVGEAAFAKLKAEVDGTLSPAEVARIRKRLGLSQREASRLMSGAPQAFQKYESGQTGVSKAVAVLLRLLDRHPDLVPELRGRNRAA